MELHTRGNVCKVHSFYLTLMCAWINRPDNFFATRNSRARERFISIPLISCCLLHSLKVFCIDQSVCSEFCCCCCCFCLGLSYLDREMKSPDHRTPRSVRILYMYNSVDCVQASRVWVVCRYNNQESLVLENLPREITLLISYFLEELPVCDGI